MDEVVEAVKSAKKVRIGVPFVKGDPRINVAGRPTGSGLSLTTEMKRKLAEVPKGSKASNLEKLIEKIFNLALKEGDQQIIKQIWAYIDGMPKQQTDVTTNGKDLQTLMVKFIEDGNHQHSN